MFNFLHDSWHLSWVTLGSLRVKVEVPPGCMVERPPLLSYVGSEMISDLNSDSWVVALSEMFVKVVSFLLQEAYDSYPF